MPRTGAEVRVHQQELDGSLSASPLPNPQGASQRLLRLGWPSLILPEQRDQRLLGLIKQAYLGSGGVCGYRKIPVDLRDLGEICGRNRVDRLMQAEGLHSQTGYRRRPGFYGGKPLVASPNHLARQRKLKNRFEIFITRNVHVSSEVCRQIKIEHLIKGSRRKYRKCDQAILC